MLDSIPNEIFWKIFFFIPSLDHINELKDIFERISNFEAYDTRGNQILKIKFQRSKTDEEVSFETNLYSYYHNATEYFDINVSHAILLCLDKYTPTYRHYFDRRFLLMCSRF